MGKLDRMSTKKRTMAIIGLILACILILFVLKFVSASDNWVCQNGQWVKNGNPKNPKPTVACPK